ncbi:hypothetical protein [Magnetococcus sp. PR-3]|uniref:hypothetical protein n=1 Tax=Magnetococcus sp. PR-3 TaxID=3120355 RepID=UPI002FCE111C
MPRFAALTVAALIAFFTAMPVQAGEVTKVSVADLFSKKADLQGKQVELTGEVVKVNNNIMNRNFLHIQDGSGDKAQRNHDITVTSSGTANKGDRVSVVGKLVLNHDFGAGYLYPVLVEEAVITPAK